MSTAQAPVTGIPTTGLVLGPVHSPRLGRVVEVDLVPHKVCPFDCIYCRFGRTTHKTIMRDLYRDFDVILEQLPAFLHADPEYIVLTGAGDPSGHAQLNQLVQRIRSVSGVPVAVMTCGALFWRADVRAEVFDADVVVARLDAGDNATFSAMNRPHPRITIDDVIEGLKRFNRAFNGSLRLEVTVVAGVNDTPLELERIRRAVRRIKPETLYLSTSAAPRSEEDAPAVTAARLEEIAAFVGEHAAVLAPERP